MPVDRIAYELDVNPRTLRGWFLGEVPRVVAAEQGQRCATCLGPPHDVELLPRAYVYLLGLYLGDGAISVHRRQVYRLRISLDRRYPGIVEECGRAMKEVLPANQVNTRLTRDNCFVVSCYSRSLPCLFPQHGRGKKHERDVSLADWQKSLVSRSPELLLRGLIQSDGCRFINTGRGGWRCPRYSFFNMSGDIREIFRSACALMGVSTTDSGKVVYVSRKADVALLDTFVGPKR